MHMIFRSGILFLIVDIKKACFMSYYSFNKPLQISETDDVTTSGVSQKTTKTRDLSIERNFQCFTHTKIK